MAREHSSIGCFAYKGSDLKTALGIALAVFAFLSVAIPCSSQEPADERDLHMVREDTWAFFIAPYGWLAGVSGTVATDGENTELEVPFEDFLENTRAGLLLYFEARRNKVFVAFDGTWATLGGEMNGQLVDLDIEIRQRIYDIRVGYEVYNKKLGEVIHKKKFDWQRRMIIDIFAGGRYFRTEPVIAIIPIIGDPREISGVDSRVDPFFGLRIGWDMSPRWIMGFRGDIGGFGIGDAAQFSWQATGDIGYRLSSRIALFAGYRYLTFDTITGRGDDRNGTDLSQQGPIIGAGFSF
jgi:hypothetical protein